MSIKSERRKKRKRDIENVVEKPAKPVIAEEPAKPVIAEEPAKPVIAEEPAKPIITEEPHKFVITDVDEKMKESLTIVSKSTLTPGCLELLAAMSEGNKDFLNAIEKLGPDAINIFCQLSKDDNYVLTTKLTIIKLLNFLGKKEFIHRILHKLGAIIQAIVNLKELITY
ncbi:hypothetical protein MBAV_000778 [Candidatus Magnetobacterium bavaricum]|uniref:Uncharacterized protein n=1 Tax=Candidatus Magnetobacterium bavaricum TaxID=29290 RepID=A0A0F3GYP7_9BACT|nr:hypothetical protein MBAV_000778 [Candidatus Magnetobacterium bavaricum]